MSTQLLDRVPADCLKYAARVTDTGGNEASFWQTGLRQQVFRGDEEFVAFMQPLASTEQRSAGYVPKAAQVAQHVAGMPTGEQRVDPRRCARRHESTASR